MENTSVSGKKKISSRMYRLPKAQLLASLVKTLQSLPVRKYLDESVVPLLLEGMAILARERPPNPIEWLAAFLLQNKDRGKGSA